VRQQLFQLGLEMFSVLEVLEERRAHADEKCLQFCIFRIRDQHFVDRIDDLLVIRDFVVDVGFIERSAGECAEIFQILFTAGFERATGVIFLRRDMELGHEINGAFVHGSMVVDHLLGEFLYGRIRRLLGSIFAGVDVDLIRGDNDRSDLGIGNSGCFNARGESERTSGNGKNRDKFHKGEFVDDDWMRVMRAGLQIERSRFCLDSYSNSKYSELGRAS